VYNTQRPGIDDEQMTSMARGKMVSIFSGVLKCIILEFSNLTRRETRKFKAVYVQINEGSLPRGAFGTGVKGVVWGWQDGHHPCFPGRGRE
jgi:hypothetical protein